MKSGSKKVVGEKLYEDMMETLKCNLFKEMMVLKEDFGFGEKRLKQFLQGVVERTDLFDDMLAEGTLEYKTTWARSTYGEQVHQICKRMAKEALPDAVFNSISGNGTLGEAQAKYARNERRRQGSISISENEKAVEKMRRMQEFLREGNR